VIFNPGGGDVMAAVPTALALTRMVNGKEQRIVVTGDADFMNNSELSRWSVRTANFYFNTALFGWFSNGQFPIDAVRPKPKDIKLTLTPRGVLWLKYLFMAIIPGLLLIGGTIFLVRRKRK
jgi:ABC-2 type transport system permease protein